MANYKCTLFINKLTHSSKILFKHCKTSLFLLLPLCEWIGSLFWPCHRSSHHSNLYAPRYNQGKVEISWGNFCSGCACLKWISFSNFCNLLQRSVGIVTAGFFFSGRDKNTAHLIFKHTDARQIKHVRYTRPKTTIFSD